MKRITVALIAAGAFAAQTLFDNDCEFHGDH